MRRRQSAALPPLPPLYASMYLHERDQPTHPGRRHRVCLPATACPARPPARSPAWPVSTKSRSSATSRTKTNCCARWSCNPAGATSRSSPTPRSRSPADFRQTVRSYAADLRAEAARKRGLGPHLHGRIQTAPQALPPPLRGSVKSSRQKFIEYLRPAQKAGLVRKNLDPTTAADALPAC